MRLCGLRYIFLTSNLCYTYIMLINLIHVFINKCIYQEVYKFRSFYERNLYSFFSFSINFILCEKEDIFQYDEDTSNCK